MNAPPLQSSATNDVPTVVAIAIAAMCIVTVDHEAIGHGSACLLLGGHITKLTSVYFACTMKARLIAGAGPFFNLIGALAAWLLLQFVPRMPRLRLLLLLVTAFAVFWEAGYLLKAMITQDGDTYFAARAAFGAPELWWRMTGCCLGLLLYMVGTRATVASARSFPSNTPMIAWIAASLTATAAAVLYTEGRSDAVFQATLEIGAASLPLLLISRYRTKSSNTAVLAVQQSTTWIVGSAIFYLAFAATLGHGLA
jgi:hypothetical protein